MEVLYYAHAALVVAGLLVYAVLQIRQRRAFGRFFADSRAYERTVALPITHREADGLCHRALRATVGHSESERRGHGHFECDGFEFRLVEHDGHTTITVKGHGGGDGGLAGAQVGSVRASYERVDRVVDWIAAAPLDGPLAEDHPSYRHFDVI